MIMGESKEQVSGECCIAGACTCPERTASPPVGDDEKVDADGSSA